MLECLKEKDLTGICDRLENVLETVTIKEYPIIEKVKKHLMDQGAKGALMSGSGPTIFAILRIRKQRTMQWNHYEVLRTSNRHT